MSEQEQTPTETPVDEAPAAVVDAPPAPTENDDQLPDWARKKLSKANDEAAKYRTQLRETEAKLAGAKTPEEHAAAVKELAEANSKLERDLLVAKVGKDLPDELAALLKGSTEEELTAHAEVLRKFVPGAPKTPPAPPTKLSGGLDGSGKGDDFDHKKIARDFRRGRL